MFIDGKHDLNESKTHRNSHIKGVLTVKRTAKRYILQEIDSIDTFPTTQNIQMIKYVKENSSARLLKRNC
jgi:hypothetical protein